MRAFSFRGRSAFNCILILFALLCTGAEPVYAQEQIEGRSAYWIFVQLEGAATTEHLAPEALERRQRRGVAAVRAGDAGVSAEHLAALEAMGLPPRVVSRWLRAVSVEASVEQIARVVALPFVRAVRRVARGERAIAAVAPVVAPLLLSEVVDYGFSREQLAVINAITPLENGIDGRGVRLGFLDCTYHGFDHPVFDELREDERLLVVRDFTEQSQNCSHGLSVASVAVGLSADTLVGPAHGASVLAAATEYGPTETRAEEDFFVQGLEWLEAQGTDVVNVSLGYTTFDVGEGDYTYGDLDGDTGITTRAVDAAAARGVTVVTSAGNSGCPGGPDACWFYVGTPADADSVITVGAVAMDSTLASFSSRGPTVDGRIKPDVVAPGVAVVAAVPGGYAYVNGTSFSSPLVAGVVAQMLQVNSDLSPIDVRTILRETASQAAAPDTLVGWGVVNAAAAVSAAAEPIDTVVVRKPFRVSQPFPNPFADRAQVELTLPQTQPVRAEVIDVLGRVRRVVHDGVLEGGTAHVLEVDAAGLAAGVYVLRVVSREGIETRRLVLAQ